MEFNDSDSGSGDISDGNSSSYIATVQEKAIILTFFGLILLTGIVGNILVMIILASVKSMHTLVNRCLFSLALADLGILVVLPILPIVNELLHKSVPFGIHFCHFISLYDVGACFCSLLTFFYVTLDRYFAICYPFKSRRFMKGSRTHIILLSIWVISFALSYPYYHYTGYEEQVDNNTGIPVYNCYLDMKENWMVWYDTVLAAVLSYLFIPVFVVLYGQMLKQITNPVNKNISNSDTRDCLSQGRGRQKVVIMLVAIVIVFIISQVPFRTVLIVYNHFPSILPEDKKNLFTLIWLCRIPLYINSAANPVIYFTLSTNFRNGFLLVFRHCRRINKTLSTTTTSKAFTVSA